MTASRLNTRMPARSRVGGPSCVLRHCRVFTLIIAITSITQPSSALAQSVLADPATMPVTATRHDFAGANAFESETIEGQPYLRSTPRRSASGLYQAVSTTSGNLSRVAWTWRVDQLHAHADVRTKTRDDFGAMVAFVFGEPTTWDRDVPTLAYVWTSSPLAPGASLRSPRFANLYYIQLRGSRDVGVMHSESRNVAADFLSTFGHEAPLLRYVVLFNDNDQTGEPTSAVFGRIVSLK